jgi:hypothetical protein
LCNPDDTPAGPDWPKEDIPDGDLLYMRVHKSYFRNGQLQPAVFRDIEGGMSVNWQKYCPTAANARRLAKTPADNGIISFPTAGAVRAIATEPRLRVEHTPDFEKLDRSHAEVIGDKKAADVRVALLKLSVWEIAVDAPLA